MCNVDKSPCLSCKESEGIPECSEKCSRINDYQWTTVLDRKHNAPPEVYLDGTSRKIPIFVF